MAKYTEPISNAEFAKYANGDYEDQVTAMQSYKKRVDSPLSMGEIASLFGIKYRAFIAI
jgi:hypothetical protein